MWGPCAGLPMGTTYEAPKYACSKMKVVQPQVRGARREGGARPGELWDLGSQGDGGSPPGDHLCGQIRSFRKVPSSFVHALAFSMPSRGPQSFRGRATVPSYSLCFCGLRVLWLRVPGLRGSCFTRMSPCPRLHCRYWGGRNMLLE